MGKFTFNPDGTIGYKKGALQSIFGGGNAEQLQAHQYNQALQQYNEQFQFQKDQFAFNKQMQVDAFNFNKGVAEFNMNLANRQQAMQEESYYNGVSNQAKQLGALGINPASQGQSLSSGPSMSAGSNVSGASAGSASAGSTSPTAGFDAFGSSKMGLEMLSLLASIKKMKIDERIANRQIDIADKQADASLQNADVNKFNAETSRYSAVSSASVNDANIKSLEAGIKNTEAKTAFQELVNDDTARGYATLQKFGLSEKAISTLKDVNVSNVLFIGAITGLDKIIEAYKNGDVSTAEDVQDSINKTLVEYANASPEEQTRIRESTFKAVQAHYGYPVKMLEDGTVVPVNNGLPRNSKSNPGYEPRIFGEY